jgi:prepilin-type N-terminal cleavage/methylation domain-containing protein
MLGKYISGASAGGRVARPAGQGRGRPGGFSLVELLAVIAIITVLMTAATSLVGSAASKSGEPASRIARSVEMARAQAVAGNRSVALRFERNGEREVALRFLRTRPGQAAGQVSELRRAERFLDLAVPAEVELELPGEAPAEGAVHELQPEESLVINPDGQVFVGTGSSGFPVASDRLLPFIHIGVQPTRGGQVVAATRRDVAVVQVQCATGTARVLTR